MLPRYFWKFAFIAVPILNRSIVIIRVKDCNRASKLCGLMQKMFISQIYKQTWTQDKISPNNWSDGVGDYERVLKRSAECSTNSFKLLLMSMIVGIAVSHSSLRLLFAQFDNVLTQGGVVALT